MKKLLLFISLTALLAFSACKGGPSDTDLQKAVNDKVATPGVTVAVKDGVATLTGEVADQAALDKIKALKIDGVKSMNFDGLKVKPAPVVVATPDMVLQKTVKDALDKKGYKDVMVSATDKLVLTGTVPKGKIQDAQMTASEAGKKPAVVTGLTEK